MIFCPCWARRALRIASGRRGGRPGLRLIGIGEAISPDMITGDPERSEIVAPASDSRLKIGPEVSGASTSSAVKTAILPSMSKSGWNSSHPRSSRGLYPSPCWRARAAAVEEVNRPRVWFLSRLGRDIEGGVVGIMGGGGGGAKNGCSISRGGRLRALAEWRRGVVLLEVSWAAVAAATAAASKSMNLPPPPGPPGTYFRFFEGGPSGESTERLLDDLREDLGLLRDGRPEIECLAVGAIIQERVFGCVFARWGW